MPGVTVILACCVGWLLWALAANGLRRTSLRGGEIETGLALVGLRVYARLVHGLRVEGRGRIPRQKAPGPLIVVANHTAGVDPLLVQAVCPFEIRWMMAADMGVPALAGLWRWAGVIFVDRESGRTGVREAIDHLRAGGVVGVFPEGRIERPARALLPFEAGIGLLAHRAGAPVLPVLIDGTPIAATAWGSLVKPSRARLRVLERMEPPATKREAAELAGRLQKLFEWESGWCGPCGASG